MDVKILNRCEQGSMATFAFPPSAIGHAVRHWRVAELWYVLTGDATFWSAPCTQRGSVGRAGRSARAQAADGELLELSVGDSLHIPPETAFQLKVHAAGPFEVAAVTMPPWQGADEALLVDGHWPVPRSNTATPTMRAGQLSDTDVLARLAFNSKAYWRYDNGFMQACSDELRVSANALRDGLTHVLELDGQIVGFASLEPLAARVYDLSHLFVAPERIGHGDGARLMQAVMARLHELDALRLHVQADPQAGPFYARMGGRFVGVEPSLSIPGRDLPCYEFDIG